MNDYKDRNCFNHFLGSYLLFLSLFYSALCFFKIPGVGFALLQALPVSKSHIKRILKETAGEEDSR